ncbi:MAG: glycosyl transferase family 1, partial [Marinilabiliales bacterium]
MNHFRSNGYDYDISYLINPKTDKDFYSKGKLIKKLWLLVQFIFIRFKDLSRAGKYDIIFIQREAFFLGTAFFEKRLSKKKAKLIFDFDDSIWLSNVSSANKNLLWLKNQGKTAKIISYADLVIAGNNYLANYARQFATNVTVIPTTIDTHEYQPKHEKQNQKCICIGWSGSITTIEHFNLAIPFLKKIKEKYGNKVCFKVIGDASFHNEELDITGQSWNKTTEIGDLQGFDIGIMPLPDSEWAKGKCGLKGLQYMALEIPTLMAPVGVNTEIIEDGVNGFLPSGTDEWVEKLSLLIENDNLRQSIGKNGRDTV